MNFETPDETAYRADDRDRMWNAWPRQCGEVEKTMSARCSDCDKVVYALVCVNEELLCANCLAALLDRRDRQISALQAELQKANARVNGLRAVQEEGKEKP